jgi:predicted nucleotidyltransferase
MGIENLLKLLNAHKVRYVVIGAAAFPVHGYSRATLDIDIFIQPTRLNVTRCLTALDKFGYDISDITIKDILSKKLLLRQYLVEADFHPFVKGVTFNRVWKNRVKDKIGSTAVNFASLDDLIIMKTAAGRIKDTEDLKILIALKKRKLL